VGEGTNAVSAVNAVVSGVVQGVGFRYSTRRAGEQLGLRGWVRNRPDGTVEVWAQGPEARVSQFVLFLETGPRHARVASLRTVEVEEDPDLRGFEVRF
jgi:acylphosphatase